MNSTSTVYSMPFAVENVSTLTSDIQRHFTNSIHKENEQLIGSFRGRPLNGTELKIPDNYLGIVAKNAQPLSKFDRITYFNLDCPTSKKDSIVRSMDYLSYAKLLHE